MNRIESGSPMAFHAFSPLKVRYDPARITEIASASAT
jgi:hypothetical protein